MEAESTNPLAHFDLVTWLAANFKKVLMVVIALAVIGGAIGIYIWSQEQSAIKANEQLFAMPSIGLAKPTGSAEGYLKAAQEQAGTAIGERAELLAAAVLFEQGKFGEAQATFEKVLKNNTDPTLQSEAALGIASCFDAQNKTSEAMAKYQEVVTRYNGTPAASQAKLSLGRLFEAQNKPDEALKLYEQLDKTQNPYDAWRSAAVEKRELLLAKHPELMKSEPVSPQQPSEQVIEVTTPPAGSTNAPIVRTNISK